MSVAVVEPPVVETTRTARPTLAVNVTAATLRDSVTFARLSVAKRAALPILGCLVLDVNAQGLTVSGFDYETYTEQRVQVDAFGRSRGRVAVNAAALYAIVAALPKGDSVRLEADADKLTISAPSGVFTLPLSDIAEYPDAPKIPSDVLATLDAAAVKRLTGVTVAAGNDDALPVLTGVYIEAIDGELVAACTDRYRVAVSEVGVKIAETFTPQLVPAGQVNLLNKWFPDGCGFHATEGIVAFTSGDRTMITRCLDGAFPKYRSLIPEQAEAVTVLTAVRQNVTAAVKLVSTALRRTQPVHIVAEGLSVKLTTGTSSGEATASVPLPGATLDGEDVLFALNPAYLLDGVAPFDKDATVRVHVKAPAKPLIFTSDSRPEFTYLLMPVRLS